MEKLNPIKRICVNDDLRTKQKLQISKSSINQKSTITIKNKSENYLTNKLISQSLIISEEQTKPLENILKNNQEIDVLYIVGIIANLRKIDQDTKIKYNANHGWMFDVQNYVIIFVGRHSLQLSNGLSVGIYAPPLFKQPLKTTKNRIQVLIERKIKNQMNDPLQYSYLIINPNNFLYPTYICSWIQCKRKITLQHYIQYNQQPNQFMILGNSIHRYLQWLISKQVNQSIVTQLPIKKLYQSFLYEMYLINLQFDAFNQKIKQSIGNLVKWYNKYVIKGQTIELNKWQKKYLRISKIIGSQVTIRSKYFGLRGKLDALFEGEYWDEKNKIRYNISIPFELKTGKSVQDSHKKQVDIYNLLVRENRKIPVIGLLYYSQSDLLESRNQNPLICFQNINIHRNKIIINSINLFENGFVSQLPKLPQILDQCKFCKIQVQCAVNRLQQSTIKDIQDTSLQTPQKYHPQIKQKLKKLTALQFKYLKKWLQLLHLQQYEQKKLMKQKKTKNYYNKYSISKNQLQKLINYNIGQILQLTIIKQIQNHQMSQQIQNNFQINQKLKIFIPDISLIDNCRIINSHKTTKIFTIQVQIKNFNIQFNKNQCQYLYNNIQLQYISIEVQKFQNISYNFVRGYCFKFVNQATIWIKQLIVQENYQKSIPSSIIIQKQIQEKQLNIDQVKAFKKCINMDKFCLVQGMPGTGKTQLIIKLIQYYYRIGQTVLITSFTNQALTNILTRQINYEHVLPIECISREGSRFGIQGFQNLSSQTQQLECIDDYKNYFKNKKIWFVTTSSLYLQHLPKKFDIVIIDQASQCLQANCLEALLKANKFILVGDQKQLQPLVISKSAIQKGMQISLFQRLCTMYSQQKISLTKQYRMSPSIMNLTNNLVYQGKLQLATKDLQYRTLILSPSWQQMVPKFLYDTIDPSKALRFINYDNVINLITDQKKTDIRRIKRLLQIKITCCLYRYFRTIGIDRSDILIISAYNSLVHQIVNALKSQQLIQRNNSDVLTIDRSQGTDKQVIILIFHEGNKQLIENERRLNVAITRAKNKFIIIGSYQQLKKINTWINKLMKLLLIDQINVDKEFLQGILYSKFKK